MSALSGDVAVGIVILLFLGVTGVIFFKEKWFKAASFAVGASGIVALLGVDFSSGFTNFVASINGAGFVASFIALAFVPLVPTKGMKQTASILGGGSLVASLMGYPSWILWVIITVVLVGLTVLGYNIVSKALGGLLHEIHPKGSNGVESGMPEWELPNAPPRKQWPEVSEK